MTTCMDAGVLAGPTNGAAEAVWRDLIDRDNRGELPIRLVGTVFTRNAEDDPKAIAADPDLCACSWNRDPAEGLICIQSDPGGAGFTLAFR